MSLIVFPCTLNQANELVMKFHRHHKIVRGHRFSLGLRTGYGEIVGAAIVGRPVSRRTDHYQVAEISRLVTNGHKNACSKLYAACARTCREMGFERIQTFILDTETGKTLTAAGWTFDAWSRGGDWNQPARIDRRTDQPMGIKQRWSKSLNRPLVNDLFGIVV